MRMFILRIIINTLGLGQKWLVEEVALWSLAKLGKHKKSQIGPKTQQAATRLVEASRGR